MTQLYEVPKATQKQLDQGFQICPGCLDHVHVLQAGFDCRHVICVKCDRSVVIKSEFFSENKIL